MRFVCSTFAGFVKRIADRGPANVFERGIGFDVSRRGVDEERLDEALKIAVTFKACAIIETGNQGQYLVELGIDCGCDLMDGERELVGSERASELLEHLEAFCKQNNLTLHEGLWNF